jgi:uncharacterized protein DUF4252
MQTKGLWTTTLTLFLVPVMSTVLGTGLAAQTSGPRMTLSGLERLKDLAAETVDVSLDTTLLSLAARFMDADDEDAAKVKAMVGGLKGVYVRSFEFGADNAFTAADVDSVRRQLTGPGWSRMAGIRSRKDHADVDVYLWLDGDKVGGLGILAQEPRRLTIVNIVGAIDLDQLRRLEGLGLPRFDLEREKAFKDKPPRDKALKDKAPKEKSPRDKAFKDKDPKDERKLKDKPPAEDDNEAAEAIDPDEDAVG